jgi:anaerobic dimethyl sulfoxide reductase subunit A
MSATIPMTCNRDCGGGCPLVATVENGRVTRIADNPLRAPTMHGCVRGYQAARTLYAPDRLTAPLLRDGERGSGAFREITWPEALDRVAEKLSDIRARCGNAAILPLGSSGACRGAVHNTGALLSRFLSLLGGYTAPTGGYSSAAAAFATPYVLGTPQVGSDPDTLQFSQLIILWGANIVDTRLGCQWDGAVRAARRRGVQVVVIDPRYSRTARELGTQWIPVRPGTDAALMLAVLYVLFSEALDNTAFAARYSLGYDVLRRHVLGDDDGQPKTPAWAEALCGTPATVTEALARQYAGSKPTALIPGLSIQRTVGGEEAIRLSIALQVATGNLGTRGGSSGALTWGRLPGPRLPGIPVPPNPVSSRIPVLRWPDAILEGRQGGYPADIAAVYSGGGNILVQGSDLCKSQRAFGKLEFAVCQDLFLTPTARYCDVVLPTTFFLEREDIVYPDGNYLLYSNRVVPPLAGPRDDYDIYRELAQRLGFEAEFTAGRDASQWLQALLDASEVEDHDAFRRSGIYWGSDQLRTGLSEFVADPLANPLPTPSGRVELASEAYARTGFPAVPTARILPVTKEHPLRLITPSSRYRTHSQNSNIPWFREQEAQTLWINPQDALPRGVADGQLVLVRSSQGTVRIPARVTEEVMPGVVSLLVGIWPTFAADGVETSGSANVLTCTTPTEPSQATRTHSVLVQVTSA